MKWDGAALATESLETKEYGKHIEDIYEVNKMTKLRLDGSLEQQHLSQLDATDWQIIIGAEIENVYISITVKQPSTL